MYQSIHLRAALFVLVLISALACGDSGKPASSDIVNQPERLNNRISSHLQELFEYADTHQGRINDSTVISNLPLLKTMYTSRNLTTIWSDTGVLRPIGDSLYAVIKNAKLYGLFPDDYHHHLLLTAISKLKTDSISRRDAALLSRTDLELTDGLLNLSYHLKRGRLPYDSLNLRKDTIRITDDFFTSTLNEIVETGTVRNVLSKLEPKLPGYVELKNGIQSFVDSATFEKYTYLEFPYSDSVDFFNRLKLRLAEERLIDSLPPMPDSAAIRKLLVQYQQSRKLKATGKINENTVKNLNNTDWEKFKRIAISLDKYKLMPDTMPHNYVWVNIPAFRMKVMEGDSLVMESKVIVGASKTKTPEIESDISNFITFPQWTVPYSIIFKEMLPQIQKDTNYLKRQNLMVVDKNDSVIPPSKINWKKLSKTNFPYLIKQREGDDNSLGVLKFNFRNKHSVYLHDTNARWLFSRSDRAMSHGCVRVQNWQQLAFYLVRNDSIKYHPDTLTSWIARQEKHVVSGFKKLPLYIRYFTCEGMNGKLKFFDDIYAEDKVLAEKYYSTISY